MPGATSGYLPPVIVKIIAQDASFTRAIQRDMALLKAFGKEDTNPRVGLNDKLFLSDLGVAKAELLAFAKEVYDARLGADARPLMSEIATIRAELKTLSPFDINIQADIAAAEAKIGVLREQLIGLKTDSLLFGNIAGINRSLAGWGSGGDGGGGGGMGGTAAAAGGAIAWVHAMHLAMPEIVGFLTAIFAVTAGFTALGVASIGAATDIYKGFLAVSTAQKAITAAIPGTSQWVTAVQSLGTAWSGIPTALQPAVAAINNFMQKMGSSGLAKEIQGFLGAQAGTLTHMFSVGKGTFAPLILATQRAIDVVEGMFAKLAGSGALSRLVGGLAHMVGPATVELAQLALALVNVASGFAKAVTDGQGLEMLVNLVRSLGAVVNSSLVQGFIAGWVDFDRIISVVLGLVAKAIGFFGSLGVNMHGVGTVLGFVVSGFIAVKSALFLLNKGGMVSADTMATFGSKLSGVLTKTAGVGLLATGIVGLVGNVSSLLHTSNPLSGVFNAIGRAIGFVSKGTGAAISTINGYKVQLSGAIPITGQLSAAMDLLVRSEQSIGSSLSTLTQGFAPLKMTALGAAQNISKVTDSIKTLEGNLAQSTTDTAKWAADAQILIKKGMNPAAVAALAQQAPQDLASMAKGTTAQLQHMNVMWQEKMLLASMSGQKGVEGMVANMRAALLNGTPVMKAAAAAVARTLGQTLNVPFNGSIKSVDAIGKALQTLPASVIATLAGKTHQYSAAIADAATKTGTAATQGHSFGRTLLAMVPNLAMVGIGIKMVGGGVGGLLGRLGEAAAGMLGFGAASDAAAASEDVAAASAGVLDVALGVGVIGAVVALGVAIYELVTHWKQVWGTIKSVSISVWDFLKSKWGMAVAAFVPPLAIIILVATHWKAIWGTIKSVAVAVWDFLTAHWRAFLSILLTLMFGPIAGLVAFLLTHWHQVKADAVAVWDAIVTFFTSIPRRIMSAIQPVVTFVWDTAKKAWHLFLSAVGTGVTTVISFISTFPGRFVRAFSGLARMMFQVGAHILQGLWNGLKSIAGHILGWVGHFASGMVSHVARFLGIKSPSTVMAAQGRYVMLGFLQGIQGKEGGTILAALRTLAKRMVTTLRIQRPIFTSIGLQLMQGLADGIRAGTGAAMAAAVAAAQAVAAATKAASQTHSPSVLYMSIARDWMLGLVEGIEGGVGMVQGAMHGAVGAVTPASHLAGGGMGAMGNVVVNAPIHITAPSGNAQDIAQVVGPAVEKQMAIVVKRLRAGSAYR